MAVPLPLNESNKSVERRNADQRYTAKIIAEVRQLDSGLMPVWLLNFSISGASFHCEEKLRNESPIFMQIYNHKLIRADLVWHKWDHYGCKFSEPLREDTRDSILVRAAKSQF